MTISQRIFNILKEKNLSQKDLSEHTGISPAAISSWKSRKTNPSSDKIMKICEFLEVSPFYLLTGESESNARNLLLTDSADSYHTTVSKEELDLLRMFHQISDLEKGRILGILEAMTTARDIME